MNCPHCNSTNTRASDRFLASDLIHWFRGQSAYRCRNCYQRFHADRGPDERLSAKMSLIWASPHYRTRAAEHAHAMGRQMAIFVLGLAIFFGMLMLVSR